VQDVFGQINDVAVLPELSAHQEAVVLAKGWIAHGLSRQLIALRRAIRHFAKQAEFWDK